MVFRLWHANIHQSRQQDYMDFAHKQSVHMFKQIDGFKGVFFLENGEDVGVLSLWQDMAAAQNLAKHPLYQDTVAQLQATGILRSTRSVEYWEASGGVLPDDILKSIQKL
jgi:heme-degrading monooxygenase HmoA